MKKKKRIKMNVGTEVMMTSPSHPYAVALQMKRIVDRVLSLPETEYEYDCNIREGLEVVQRYGAEQHSQEIDVLYFINGARSTFEQVMTDLDRGRTYVEQLIAEENDKCVGNLQATV
jgi:hypothetical protein